MLQHWAIVLTFSTKLPGHQKVVWHFWPQLAIYIMDRCSNAIIKLEQSLVALMLNYFWVMFHRKYYHLWIHMCIIVFCNSSQVWLEMISYSAIQLALDHFLMYTASDGYAHTSFFEPHTPYPLLLAHHPNMHKQSSRGLLQFFFQLLTIILFKHVQSFGTLHGNGL